PVGYHSLRLTTVRGISNLKLFCIDDLPQAPEVTSNRDKTTPQALPVPCVVAGTLDAEKSTWFQITVKAGERLSFDVLGRRLGGPIDPQLSIYDVASKREIAYENDSPGCQSDPRLSYVFKTAGDYLIEVKDVLNRGGGDYVFRLRVGDFPLATVPIPMAIQRGHSGSVAFAGPEVHGVLPVKVTAPKDFVTQALWVAPKGPSGLYGWPVALAVSDLPELVDIDQLRPEPDKILHPEIPVGVTSRLQKSDQTNSCIFTAKKGQKLLVEVQTLELGSPTLVYMVLRNAKTKAEIAKSNPQANPPLDQTIDFTAPEDGDYVVEVQHLNYLGGPSEAYHLTITPSRPSFEVTVSLDRFDLAADGFVALPLQVKRTNFAGPIDVTALGPAGLTGHGTIAANQPAGILLLKAKDLPLGPKIISLVAEATIDKAVVKQLVSVRQAVSQSLTNLPLPPRDLLTQIAIGVREGDPFRLIATLDQNGCVAGLPANFTVAVERGQGFDGDVALNPPGGLPPGVAPPKLPTIAKGQKEVTFKLDINTKVPPGPYQLTFSGKGKRDGKEFTVAAMPTTLDVITQPFDLEITPAKVSLAAGDKGKITVKAIRKGGYDGPITVEVKNLPAKVTATKGTIAKGQGAIDLEISAAADAPLGSKMDVQISGMATALGNVTGNSPNFAVVIEKKE
ncbi:MAG TPA: hypothetical protein VG099_05245, partial [Gemmataceae bacterium]|nr:hypothetical protein [Gemmataceae bacterium]